MGKTTAKGRSKHRGPHMILDYSMMEGPAYRSLTANDRSVLFEIMRRHYGNNNCKIAMSSRDAGRLARVNKTTAAKSLRTLCDRGFLIVRNPSSFGTNGRLATEYELTMFPPSKGKPAKRSFQQWRPPPENNPSSQTRDIRVPKEGHRPALRVVS